MLINKAPKRKKRDKYTNSARGQECQLRFPGCSYKPEETVFAHLDGAGSGTKHQNIHGAYSCQNCHDVIARLKNIGWSWDKILLRLHEAVIQTQILMIQNGILKL